MLFVSFSAFKNQLSYASKSITNVPTILEQPWLLFTLIDCHVYTKRMYFRERADCCASGI